MLHHKVIVVTGGAGRLGQAFINAILKAGGRAVIADKNVDAGELFAKTLLEDHPEAVLYHPLDITDKSSIQKLIKNVLETFGIIDAWVNNAYPRNAHYGRELMNVTYEDFCENMNWNVGGYFLCSQQIADYFLKKGCGNIIQVASIYGVIAPKFSIYDNTSMTMPVEYAAIKSSLIHLTRYFASYFKGKNIRINTLSPGGILDEQPTTFLNSYQSNCLNKGMLDPQDITGSLLFLLSDLSKYINGQNIIVDDGFTL